MNILFILNFFLTRNGSFPLDNCEILTGALLKLISKCYWNTTDSEGCMTSDENELSEACIKTLTVIIGRICIYLSQCIEHIPSVKKKKKCCEQRMNNIGIYYKCVFFFLQFRRCSINRMHIDFRTPRYIYLI